MPRDFAPANSVSTRLNTHLLRRRAVGSPANAVAGWFLVDQFDRFPQQGCARVLDGAASIAALQLRHLPQAPRFTPDGNGGASAPTSSTSGPAPTRRPDRFQSGSKSRGVGGGLAP